MCPFKKKVAGHKAHDITVNFTQEGWTVLNAICELQSMTNREVPRRVGGGGGGHAIWRTQKSWNIYLNSMVFKGICTVYPDQNLVGNELITENSRQRKDNTV